MSILIQNKLNDIFRRHNLSETTTLDVLHKIIAVTEKNLEKFASSDPNYQKLKEKQSDINKAISYMVGLSTPAPVVQAPIPSKPAETICYPSPIYTEPLINQPTASAMSAAVTASAAIPDNSPIEVFECKYEFFFKDFTEGPMAKESMIRKMLSVPIAKHVGESIFADVLGLSSIVIGECSVQSGRVMAIKVYITVGPMSNKAAKKLKHKLLSNPEAGQALTEAVETPQCFTEQQTGVNGEVFRYLIELMKTQSNHKEPH